jgi:acetyltransferase-like isoleucine patch superfamily enzyme
MSDEWKKPRIRNRKMTKYNYIVQYPENLKLGKKIDIGTFTYINCQYGVEIQDNVQVGSHCAIYSNSTIDFKSGSVVLEKNCKVGTHSTVMPNVIIGKNSVVAAYSFVTRNIPEDELWAGIPAKFKSKIKVK